MTILGPTLSRILVLFSRAVDGWTDHAHRLLSLDILISITSAMAWNWTADSKLCFVTTGATAPFTELIESVLSPTCLDSLREGGFTHLLVQYGSAEDVYKQFSKLASAYIQETTSSKGALIIDGIDFNPDGLKTQFQLVQRSKGLVISHAGTSQPLRFIDPSNDA